MKTAEYYQQNSSFVLEHNNLPGHKCAEDHKGISDQKPPVKSRKLEVLRLSFYRGILEIIKSALLIFSFLTLYKVTGFHDWWIQLVGTLAVKV
jgi:hypothetical protein